jgi:hypothetical protein
MAVQYVKQPLMAVQCVKQPLMAVQCVKQPLMAVHCVQQPLMAVQCVKQSLIAVHCVQQQLMAVHCVQHTPSDPHRQEPIHIVCVLPVYEAKSDRDGAGCEGGDGHRKWSVNASRSSSSSSGSGSCLAVTWGFLLAAFVVWIKQRERNVCPSVRDSKRQV